MMNGWLQDLRYGLRMLAKSPGFALMAVLTLAVGIGANTAIFSAVDAIMLRPLPYPGADRLVLVNSNNLSNGVERMVMSGADFADLREQSGAFEYVAGLMSRNVTLTGGAIPEEASSAVVTQDFFVMQPVAPLHGRVFHAQEFKPEAQPVVLLAHGLWQRRFGGDPAIVGQTINIDDTPRTVIGVMPPGLLLPDWAEVWLPLTTDPRQMPRGSRSLQGIARLRPGVSLEQARLEMSALARRLEEAYPETNTGIGAGVLALREAAVGRVRPALLAMLIAVGFVLLIACVNVANLLLTRATARQREIAIRAAVGASRWRVVRQLLTESVLLALAGGGLGVLLAWWGVDLFVAMSPENTPRRDHIGVDGRILAFTFFLSCATGLLFGLLPALQASRPDLNEVLKEGGRTTGAGGGRLRGMLVVGEVALSVVLLVGAGLMLKSFAQLMRVDPGFRPDNLLAIDLDLPPTRYDRPEKISALVEGLLPGLASLPGVESVAATRALPFEGGLAEIPFRIAGQTRAADQAQFAGYSLNTPDYFATMGIPLLQGRDFNERDRAGAPGVAIINETLARQYFGERSPLGEKVTLGDGKDGPREVVGVVGDVKHFGLGAKVRPTVFVPYLQKPTVAVSVVVRTAQDPLRLVEAMRQQVWQLDRDLPVEEWTMQSLIADSVAEPRFNTALFAVFAGVALLLAVIGVYGVMSYTVAQRTHEIGIRMALGAKRGDVLAMVLGHGMKLALAGVAVGLGAALLLTRWLESLLFEVSPNDPLTFAAISGVLVLVALLACLVPARRATRVDPMEALRYE